MQVTVITCDICKDEIKGFKPTEMKLTEIHGIIGKTYHYEHICTKCVNELVHFIEDGLKKKPKEQPKEQ